MVRVLFHPKVNLGISVVLFAAGLFFSVGNLAGLIGKGEPVLVYQMSAMALWYSAYGNILISVVMRENEEKK